MLRKSIPLFKIGAIILALGIFLYFFSEDYGKYVMGAGMMVLALGFIFYILYMFRRYGEQKKIM
jgi:high-affinity Fe2+/Pb2+ permease